jgi:hypothetical protein
MSPPVCSAVGMNDSSTNGFIPIETRKSKIRSALKNEYTSLSHSIRYVHISSFNSPWKRTWRTPSSARVLRICACQSARNASNARPLPTVWLQTCANSLPGASRLQVNVVVMHCPWWETRNFRDGP